MSGAVASIEEDVMATQHGGGEDTTAEGSEEPGAHLDRPGPVGIDGPDP
jgi:hypothetical protein